MYLPHSNECGIRALLALTIQALHPEPAENILLPIMHQNLSQIGRAWIALSLINQDIAMSPIQQALHTNDYPRLTPTQRSDPATIIPWSDLGPATTRVAKDGSLLEPHSPSPQLKGLNPAAPTISPSHPTSLAWKPLSSTTLSPFKDTREDKPRNSQHPISSKEKPALAKKLPRLNPTAPEFFPQSSLDIRCINQATKPPSPPIKKSKSQAPSKKLHQRSLHSFLSLKPPTKFSLADELDTWGHALDEIDPSKTFRILLQNPNGIQPGRRDYDFQYSLAKCHSLGIGALSIVETKLNSTTQSSQASRWFSKTWEFSSTVQSQIDENFSSSYQPGGTLTAVVDRWTSRIQGKGLRLSAGQTRPSSDNHIRI
jgi:hypothetical protein